MGPPSPLLARFRPEGPLPPSGELGREAATDPGTGAKVELVRPLGAAALRPGAEPRWAAAWTPSPAAHPAVLPSLAVDHRLAVRPAIAGPWTPALRLRPDEARAAAGWLGGALLRGVPGLGGELRLTDLVIDADGAPRISPSGIVLIPDLTDPGRHLPPTRAAGPEGERDAALYGLGVALFGALTGALPADGRTPEALRAAQARPRRLRELDPTLPADLDDLLAALLDPDPHRRAPAIVPLAARAEPPRISVPAPAPQPSPALKVREQGASAPGGRADLPTPAWGVELSAGATLAARRRAAALMGVAVPEGSAGPWPLSPASTAVEAAAQVDALRAARAPIAAVRLAPPAWTTPASVLGWAVVALLAPIIAGIAGLGAAALAAGAGLLLAIAGGATARAAGRAARAFAEQLGAHRPAGPFGEARAAVLRAELSAPEQADMLDAIDLLEETDPAGSPDTRAALAALVPARGPAADERRRALDQAAAVRAAAHATAAATGHRG